MPISQVTFPDGTIFSNRAPAAVLDENEIGLAEGGHDPGMFVFAEKLISLAQQTLGSGASSTSLVACTLGEKVFEITGTWTPSVGDTVMAWLTTTPDNYLIGTVTASATGSVTVDVEIILGEEETGASWVITWPGKQIVTPLGAGVPIDNAWPRIDVPGGNTLQLGKWTEADNGEVTAGGGLNMNAETVNVAGSEVDASGAVITLTGGEIDASAGLIKVSKITGVEGSADASTSPTVSIAIGQGQYLKYTGDADGIIDFAPAAAGTYYAVLIRWINETGGRDLTLKFSGATTFMLEDNGVAVEEMTTDFTADGASVEREIGVTVYTTHAIAKVGSPYTPA